ncbi:hypothetical protein EW145_g1488 [Phellinidium pouzarii]|uniref:FAD-binding domain-containing protein n=1 Tax=Phellinidium pouzarii TaxID=167371 RepID=A0A4S4LEB0_9AGAM|nr:hypothetical protein EW145_g1488 [Phellinidium pouzarii]
MAFDNERTKQLKVAVVGGGMCGLVAALGLRKAGIDVDLYESARRLLESKFGEIGAGVGLGPNAIRVLEQLELLDDVLARIAPEMPVPRPFRYLSGFEDHELIYDYPTNTEDKGLGIHRSAEVAYLCICERKLMFYTHRVTFLEALVHLVDSNKTHFNKRCIGLSIPSDSRVQINFADGTSAEADVALGADGIRSNVRSFVVAPAEQENSVNGNEIKATVMRAVFTNTYAYRGLVPTEELRKLGVKTDFTKRPICLTGSEKQHIITFPIKNGTVINVVAFTCERSYPWGAKPIPQDKPWVTPRTTSELLAEYAGFGRDALMLLSCIAKPSVWAVHAVDPPLEAYVRGRVAVLGDAAHGMLPHLGAGAGQALEDAFLLVKLLSHPKAHTDNVEVILKAYDTIRRPRGNMVLTTSTKVGDIYEGYGPSELSTGELTPEGLRADVEGIWDDIWHHDLEADIEAAIALLVDAGAF